jgi:hypothetical protein
VFDALERPDAAVRALWHPDVEFDVSRDIWGALVGGGRYRGVDGVRSWMLDLYSGWEKMDLTCEELIDAGEQVISVLSVRGRGRVSGIELEYRPRRSLDRPPGQDRPGRVVSSPKGGSRSRRPTTIGRANGMTSAWS